MKRGQVSELSLSRSILGNYFFFSRETNGLISFGEENASSGILKEIGSFEKVILKTAELWVRATEQRVFRRRSCLGVETTLEMILQNNLIPSFSLSTLFK